MLCRHAVPTSSFVNSPTRKTRAGQVVLACVMSLLYYAPKAEAQVSYVCEELRYEVKPGREAELIGAKFEASSRSDTEGYETLAEIKERSAKSGWNDIRLPNNKKVFRWYRFVQPKAVNGKLAKVEFRSSKNVIAAEGVGTPMRFFVNDRDSTTMIGYDVQAACAQRPSFIPGAPPSVAPGPLRIQMTGQPGAVVRYTVNGQWPTLENSYIYEKPLPVNKSTTLSAVAFAEGKPASMPNVTTYLIEGSSKPGLVSAHLGNSLTGTTNGFWRYARTAGYDHKSTAFLRGGALTRELWKLATGEYAGDPLALVKEKDARNRGSLIWADFWKDVGKVDVLTMQPRDFDLTKEVEAEVNFIKMFREKSPEVQPWLYCEWVEQRRQRPSDLGQVPSYQMTKTFPALTWEESMSAMLLYVEELQHRLDAMNLEGKRPRILPTALMMGWIKNKIDHKQFGDAKPGTFYQTFFNDQVHPNASPGHGNANGGYIVDLTWYSAFYREPADGKVLPIETTLSPEQVEIAQELAWSIIQNYPDCGLYENGSEPCADPQFANNGKTITLTSATPDVWFRYTLDGTPPTRTRGYVYCGAISVQPGIQVKAVAYRSGMADSAVAEMKAKR